MRPGPLSIRPAWMPPRQTDADRRLETNLLVAYLERRMGAAPQPECVQIRSFLVRYGRATRGGNPAGIRLGIGQGNGATAAVYPYVPGAGRVAWLPALVLPMTDHLDEIMRRVQRKRSAEYADEPKRDAWGSVEARTRRGISPEVSLRIVEPSPLR